ncbi:MAG: MBL fold metallo-hydrolase [Dehalococcoidia bacterium]
MNRVIDIAANLKLLDPQIPIPAYSRFIGSYLVMGERKAIIDPGPASARPGLLSAVEEAGLRPEDIRYIVLTHIHVDHAGGVGAVIPDFPNATVLAHSRARPHLIDPTALWNSSIKVLGELAVKYGPMEPVPAGRIAEAADRMIIDLGGTRLEVYLTPGHAVHHLSLFDRGSGILIAGEAAGVCVNGVIRPATPPPFKLEETVASIDRLVELEPQKICYGHFGCYDNGLERLRHYRDKLFLWQEVIRSAIAGGTTINDILSLLKERDSDLDYLDGLNSDEYAREMVLLNNSIMGIAGTTRRP